MDLLIWNPDTQITKANYTKAAALAKKLKTAQADIENELSPSIQQAHQLHKNIKAVMDRQLDKYQQVEAVLKDKFAAFHVKNPNLKIDQVSFVDYFDIKIIDESKIPDNYKITVPDIAKIKKELKASGALFSCPGIDIVSRAQVRFYGSKD